MDGEVSQIKYVFNVAPCSAPRMTRSDAWKKRACVVEYFRFKDALREEAKRIGFSGIPAYGARIIFYIEPPASWSRKKKTQATICEEPVTVKPDVDNLAKAFLDTLCPDGDSYIWDLRGTKRYSDKPRIEVIFYGQGQRTPTDAVANPELCPCCGRLKADD